MRVESIFCIAMALSVVDVACGGECFDCTEPKSGHHSPGTTNEEPDDIGGPLGKIGPGSPSISNDGFECAVEPCEVLRLSDAGGSQFKLAVASGFVYYLQSDALYRVPIDGSGAAILVMNNVWADIVSNGHRVFTITHRRVVLIEGPTGAHSTLDVECGISLGVNDQALFVTRDKLIIRRPFDGSPPRTIGLGDEAHLVGASNRWVCWSTKYGNIECVSAFGGSSSTQVSNRRSIAALDDSHVYYTDAEYNMRRKALPGGESELVFSNAEGGNSNSAHSDSRYLYWIQSSTAQKGRNRVLRLEKSSGTIELFGILENGAIVGGNDEYLFVDSPLRRIRK